MLAAIDEVMRAKRMYRNKKFVLTGNQDHQLIKKGLPSKGIAIFLHIATELK